MECVWSKTFIKKCFQLDFVLPAAFLLSQGESEERKTWFCSKLFYVTRKKHKQFCFIFRFILETGAGGARDAKDRVYPRHQKPQSWQDLSL